MSVSKEFLDYVMEQFQAITDCQYRKMFGGVGIYHADAMFALISSDDVVYLKCDDSNRSDFEDAGMQQFTNMPYFELPSELLEDVDILLPWVSKAVAVGVATKKL